MQKGFKEPNLEDLVLVREWHWKNEGFSKSNPPLISPCLTSISLLFSPLRFYRFFLFFEVEKKPQRQNPQYGRFNFEVRTGNQDCKFDRVLTRPEFLSTTMNYTLEEDKLQVQIKCNYSYI